MALTPVVMNIKSLERGRRFIATKQHLTSAVVKMKKVKKRETVHGHHKALNW